MCCPCGRWLSSGARDRSYCIDHSLDRKDRINRTLFNCAGGIPALTDFSYQFRSKYAELFTTYEEVDCTGCRIICLSLRPDTASVRSLSKFLYSKGGCTNREDYVAWCLLAQRLFDPACIRAVLQPLATSGRGSTLVEFNMESLKELRKRLRTYNEEASQVYFGTKKRYQEFEARQCNPTGSAGAHSGHPFLRDLIRSQTAVNDFIALCSEVADVIFAGHDYCKSYDQDDISEAISANKITHTATYYKMSMCRVALHCISHSSSKRVASWPSCKFSEDLWLLLLEYDGGCKKGARHFGLIKYADAVAFCIQMRKHIVNYCLCDLACWLCLAPINRGCKRKSSS